jgi:hypothetical protein
MDGENFFKVLGKSVTDTTNRSECKHIIEKLEEKLTDEQFEDFFSVMEDFFYSILFFRKWRGQSIVENVVVYLGDKCTFRPEYVKHIQQNNIDYPCTVNKVINCLHEYEKLVNVYTKNVVDLVLNCHFNGPSEEFMDALEDLNSCRYHGYDCQFLAFNNCISLWNVSERISGTIKIQRWFRRRQFLIKYRTLFEEIIGIPANHDSILGRLFPKGGFLYKETYQNMENVLNSF